LRRLWRACGARRCVAAARGVALIPEGRGIFGDLSVQENLRLGAFARRARQNESERLTEVLTLFPRLAERRRQPARLMSGGEQQMLAIARALMSSPDILLLDEPSVGLSPRLSADVFSLVRRHCCKGYEHDACRTERAQRSRDQPEGLHSRKRPGCRLRMRGGFAPRPAGRRKLFGERGISAGRSEVIRALGHRQLALAHPALVIRRGNVGSCDGRGRHPASARPRHMTKDTIRRGVNDVHQQAA
jgi:ABC transporter